ncbi:MAG: hypothetical protein PF693_03845 [Spirochaetia bacterium]|jgi:hypothetical protein|nr:hypothetical protein [Spirochaetia bacterium]
MGKENKKGRGKFYLFLILAALGGVFVAGFPVVEVMFPDIAGKVNNFRGYYSGQLFVSPDTDSEDYFTEEFHGFKSTMAQEQLFYFIPAANINFDFSAYYDDYSNTLLEFYLYKADDMGSIIATNINVPYAEGRQAGAASQQGAEMPEHANWFSSECTEGIVYTLKVIPKNGHDIGTDFIIRIDVAEGWISLPGLWGLFVGILFFLLILSGILKFIWKVRRKSS